ncbi:polysaccharide deacetylase family protein [Phenylobacterium sp.]|uniref:polysaccharide deacetylase family protein n=1 Tax=Phenylobacterium sp. TaxID=1871053 RepID=UPI00121B960E|nr:polysaccharide deacetylase family protein [Phenylobacterium sp.]THD64786.1 MAG: polysaccharide deacetylase [Phenylobacterium sp.]
MRLALIAAGLALAWASNAAAEPVAVTFDDVPYLSLTAALDYQQTTTRELLAGLKHNHIPAIGFVNEIKLEGPDKPQRVALLTAWLNAGMDLGNHSYSHISLTHTPVADYIADVAKGERVTRALMAMRGEAPHWFRHPYLETGATAEARTAFESWLGEHGYRVAPVSMENSDWVFALPYDDAVLHGDKADADHIRRSYLDFTAKVIPWYQEAADDVLGRRPAFVLLLHASRLNADSIGELAKILKADGLKPVPLHQAMKDPAYAIPDPYIGPDGDEWVTRWSLALHKPVPWKALPEPAPEIVAADARLDDDLTKTAAGQ